MAITITKADVKRKCMIPTSDTSYDSSIDSLIAEMQPAIEYGIESAYLAETGNAGLQATLKLGILELMSGEFLEQMCREAGASEEFSVAGVTVGERKERGMALMQQGAERLAPYLKSSSSTTSETQIKSTTEDADRILSGDESAVW